MSQSGTSAVARVERRTPWAKFLAAGVSLAIGASLLAIAPAGAATDEFAGRYDPERVSSSPYNIAKNIGADDLWGQGFTGQGVDVAVIDTGVAARPELAGHVVDGPDLSFGEAEDGVDGFGHGTHMAGIIGGLDPAVPLDGRRLADRAKDRFVGIAPGARIVNLKVAAEDGAVDVSQVIAAIDWVVQHRTANGLNIRVLNLAFGTDGIQDYRLDPLTFAVENAWRHGIVVVVSAGNDGYGTPRLNNPAYDPFVLAVGASDTNGTASRSDDFIADFSSRGEINRRPDIVAPGRSVVSLRAPGSLIDTEFPEGRVDENLFRGSGTSQAAAVTSGAVALLLERYPQLTPDQVKAALVSTGERLRTDEGQVLESGMTSLDIEKAASKVKDVVTGKIPSAQNFEPATGLGSLDAARGSERLSDGDTTLSGEVDVSGAPWDPTTWTAAAANATAWTDVAWDGLRWRAGEWNGLRWRNDAWTGLRWRTGSWDGLRWRSGVWDGLRWRGTGWLSADLER